MRGVGESRRRGIRKVERVRVCPANRRDEVRPRVCVRRREVGVVDILDWRRCVVSGEVGRRKCVGEVMVVLVELGEGL